MTTMTESHVQQVKDEFASSLDNSERVDSRREDDEHRRAMIESSAQGAFDRRNAERDFEDSRELREELEARFPGRKASEVLDEFLKIDASLRRDPANAAYELAKRFSRSGRIGEPGGRKPAENPYHEKSVAHDIYAALRQAQKDGDESSRILESRKKLGGASLRETFKRILDIENELARDPFKAAGRIAASYGMPLDDADLAEQQRIAAEIQKTVGGSLEGRGQRAADLVASGAVKLTGNVQTDVAAILKLLSGEGGKKQSPRAELKKAQGEARTLKKAAGAVQEDSSLRDELRRQLRAAGGRR